MSPIQSRPSARRLDALRTLSFLPFFPANITAYTLARDLYGTPNRAAYLRTRRHLIAIDACFGIPLAHAPLPPDDPDYRPNLHEYWVPPAFHTRVRHLLAPYLQVDRPSSFFLPANSHLRGVVA